MEVGKRTEKWFDPWKFGDSYWETSFLGAFAVSFREGFLVSWLTSSYLTGVVELYMNYYIIIHFGGIKQYIQMYGDFEGFPVLQCIVWVGDIMNSV